MAEEEQPYGLMFSGQCAAGELTRGQIIVHDGHVIDVRPEPDDADRVRLTLVTALGLPPGRNPDQRTVELVCPRDMVFGTATPSNIELAPPPPPNGEAPRNRP